MGGWIKIDVAEKHFVFQLYFLFDAKLTIKFKFNTIKDFANRKKNAQLQVTFRIEFILSCDKMPEVGSSESAK